MGKQIVTRCYKIKSLKRNRVTKPHLQLDDCMYEEMRYKERERENDQHCGVSNSLVGALSVD